MNSNLSDARLEILEAGELLDDWGFKIEAEALWRNRIQGDHTDDQATLLAATCRQIIDNTCTIIKAEYEAGDVLTDYPEILDELGLILDRLDLYTQSVY